MKYLIKLPHINYHKNVAANGIHFYIILTYLGDNKIIKILMIFVNINVIYFHFCLTECALKYFALGIVPYILYVTKQYKSELK